MERVRKSFESLLHNHFKKSFTPGFFARLAIKEADGLDLQDANSDQELGQSEDRVTAAVPLYDAKPSGGFRDVGKHTTAEALPTCWPLVEQVFHFIARRVSTTASAELAPLPNLCSLPGILCLVFHARCG